MKRIITLTTLMLIAVLIYSACGGSSAIVQQSATISSPSPARKLSARLGALPGFAGLVRKSQAPASVSAATATPIVMSGSFAGFCQTTPADATFIIYGLGKWDDSDCQFNFSSFSNAGAPVIGDGTLSSLVVNVAPNGSTQATSGVVVVLVNGSATALTCTVGTSNRCEDASDSVAVHDGDSVTATMQTSAGDSYQFVRVAFVKE